MSEPAVQEAKRPWDAPNQQVVRPDESAPWEEGDGGSTHEPAGDEAGLDAMTKAQMLDYAAEHGVDADDSMTKAQIHAAILAATAE